MPLHPLLSPLDLTVGIWTSAHELVMPTASSEVARTIESLGFAALWFPEAWARESLTSATLLLSATSRLKIATGITNIWGRDAVATVNAARTLNAAFDDRFVLGLGVSHRPLVERLRGQVYESPLQTMRRYLDAMDAAPMHAPEAQQAYPRVIAALGPQMLRLGGERADGVHTYLVDVEHTAIARSHVGDKFIAVEQAVVVGGDRDEFLRRAHTYLEFYTGLENYRANWRRMGFGDEDFVRGGSDRLCDAMVVHGEVDAIVASIDAHRAAGANHVCLQVLGESTTEAPVAQWRTIAEALGLS